jgi:hypothetical protein
MEYCQNCQNYEYSANYCPTCGTAFGTVATVAESSYEVVAYTIKESVNPLIEYVDKNGGKAEVSAQIGNHKISTSYTQEASEISYTSYTPITAFECTDTYECSNNYECSDTYECSDNYECSDTVTKSSSSISIGEFANIIKKSAEATVEYAKLGSYVKVITQIDDIEITTSYTPENE